MTTFSNPYVRNFLGNTPDWFKITILSFLALNPLLYYTVDTYVAGWVLVAEFIFCLAMALKCYPLQPGGLLAIEAVALGMTSPGTVLYEVEHNLEVILLLMFMVAGIYFLKSMLLFLFTKILVGVRSKLLLSLLFSFTAAILSAFLDALTVTAVVITIAVGFFSIYHKVASGKDFTAEHDYGDDASVSSPNRGDLEQFRAFLRSLMMHAAVGTALGGVMTLVGEPQNILIGNQAGWGFIEFIFRMLPVTLPVLVTGLLTVVLLETTGWFGYGAKLPDNVFNILSDYERFTAKRRTKQDKAAIVVQAVVALWLVAGLMGHFAAVGLIGLSVIVLATSFSGVIEEHRIGHAFEEALPFTSLLVVFFVIVAVIKDQSLFAPVTSAVLDLQGTEQIAALFAANGILSAISDNVFVATVYMGEMTAALSEGMIDRDTYDLMAVAINTGTNIPSVATPNGQAAFLFLLTSALAPLIRLSYLQMVKMAFPYCVSMSLVAFLGVSLWLEPVTDHFYELGLINHHTDMPSEVASEGHGNGH
ncbi:sodium/proton antiporter (NhaB family) /sodium or potassium/proton antiporter (NhaB family) [Rhodothalassium salexigens DSM 2132]|uniref:Sodium/proton antiporter (NhaB family) /sodium or potassium/proton antiporter (NhaB family) n=1 Tax=Rhodothalassium salexigens DSM 2132 TaxID=1188247 RepID=A0A4R2PPC3_RHOSA|nr:sodium/proton antiporter NhaB [Rhodothalassium salexigens]MBB4210826.1 NhaB family Na+:H+ antiporter [Rhodothalassium salexigens DSM 2132]TCP37619.1 sodium/proton antiporter (NhaB family) /sodium or potassium/proton antiporter (NhaB family) [Rhodothalassium salexigens DSM 2132]